MLLGLPSLILGMVRFVLRWAIKLIAWVARPLSWAFDRMLGALASTYPRVLGWSLRARPVVLGVALLALLGAASLVPKLGLNLIPQFSQGEFSFLVELPEGTPLQATDRFMADIQTVLADDTRVASYSTIAGGSGLSLTSTGTEGENTAALQVRMNPDASREDEAAVIAVLRERLAASDLAHSKFERPTYFSFRTPIEVEVYSDQLEELHQAAALIQETIRDVPGLVDVKSSAELGNPELHVTFNRDQLVRLDLDVASVASTLRNKIQGQVATRFTQADREIDILVRSVDDGQASVDEISQMIVGQRAGVPIFLKSVANIRVAEGPTEIRRIGQKRTAVISGNLSGRDMGAVAADIRSELKALALPGGVVARLSGQEEEMARSLNSLLLAMALAIFLVYLVMASQFESFLHPFVIIFTLPLGAIGVIVALFLTGTSINIVAMIGMVMLAGIVVNNAIVLIDAINQRRNEGMDKHAAILDAASSRLRPILMTTATTVLGLAPMALGLGAGAELRGPMAITVIGGLVMGTFLTLLIIPVVYSLLDRKVYAAAGARPAVPEGDAFPEFEPEGGPLPLMPGSPEAAR
ncbi:MAG: efflux RND transporter permease subunit [Acidobacteria bacterium]|nr:MAG: efflux RND transporter permease subunit [Acidobacteriota bacterium]